MAQLESLPIRQKLLKTIPFFDTEAALPLKKSRSLIPIVLVLLSLFLVSPRPQAHADAAQPTLIVGNHWTYALTATSGGLSISATVTLTIVDEETITISGNTYDAFRIAESGTGSATGPTLTAAVSVTGYSLARHSDLGDIQDLVSTSITANGQTFKQIQTTTNTPPTIPAKFPLTVGGSWTFTTTSQTNVTSIPPIGPPTTTVYSNTTTTTAVVVSSQLTTVPAGTFDTYLVRASQPKGSQEAYYSPEVMQPVKEVSYNSTGAATSTIQLQSYNAWPFSTSITAHTGGTSYNITLQTDVAATGLAQNPTTLTFQISGADTVTGRANVTIPQKFNNTDITVQVDSSATATATTILKDSTNYYVFFTLTLSTHTVTLTYATTNTGLPWLLILGIVAAVAVVVIVATIALLRRKKAPSEIPPAIPGPLPTTPPPPSVNPP
jgi:hypothetical protein